MQTKAHIKATTKYESKAYDKICLRLRKDDEPTRDTITKYATDKGMSVNAFVLEAIKNYMKE